MIEHQIRLIRKNLTDLSQYTVADNSSDRSASEAIAAVCDHNKVAYMRLPRSPLLSRPSQSHGAALNWVLANYIRPRAARYFGFIDHDVFPIRPTSVIAHLERAPAWGHVQTQGEAWYLWPGLCFFNSDETPAERLDFMPRLGVDTGGQNFATVFRALDRRFEAPESTFGQLREGDDPQSDMYQLIGDWLHTLNASHWKPVPARDHLVNSLLETY